MSDRGYKPILLQVCITDLINLALTFFYMPVYVVGAGDYELCYTTGFFNDVFQDASIFTMLTFNAWFFFHFMAVCSPAVQFLYRYLVLCRKWTPSYRLYAALLSAIVLILLTYPLMSSLLGVVVYASRSSNVAYQKFILTPNPSNVDLLLVKKTSTTQVFALIVGIVVILEYVIIMVCGLKIWLYFRRNFQLVSIGSNQKLQRQINYVLFVQALLPILGLLIPVCIDVFGSIFRANIAAMPFIFQFSSLWIMNANPLFTILLIESYRRTILGCCSASSRTTSTTIIKAVNISAHNVP
ncbi:serpentine type 7TM GPCR chemoreceptor str domain-containing protein [Ditylenchus destructor]|uniref:Serpentine type 7TM GPCR chemoreceptor str domain-containing protein n=1 Tax=Ditylenchus destructor TaxID=166010 RepID=A0AAD4MND9_9BILA|nr:serpentine type 7TM GPCR chemoreceptor str domain-containing protein [Ditylenchus destructor]